MSSVRNSMSRPNTALICGAAMLAAGGAVIGNGQSPASPDPTAIHPDKIHPKVRTGGSSFDSKTRSPKLFRKGAAFKNRKKLKKSR